MENTIDVDLLRALELVTDDQRGDLFYKHPFEIDILKKNTSWLARLSSDLNKGTYTPSQARPVDVPKPEHHIRPASHLTLHDQVALSFLLLKCKPSIASTLSWSESTIRQSHWVSSQGQWFRDQFEGWKRFRDRSLQLINEGANFVLTTDISGYYENIDISKIVTELKNIDIPGTITDQLSACLNKWAGPRRRGIPQGYSACHLLGELYLDSLDHNLKSEGFVHLRFLDDIRVFAATEHEARKALHRITILLRERGLNIHTSKSKVMRSSEAASLIDGVAPIIRGVSEQIANELDVLEDAGYVGLEDSRRALENLTAPPPEVIQRGWQQFENGDLGGFNKTLYHYFIKRLGRAKLRNAVDYALALLEEHPEETAVTLEYLWRAQAIDEAAIGRISEVVTGSFTLFAHQRYVCLRWLWEHNLRSERVLDYCRTLSSWPPERFIVRPYAIAYIGRFASLRDFERLEAIYRDSTDWLERATVVCAYRNAITEMRNSFYGRIRGEHDLVDRAIAYAKAS